MHKFFAKTLFLGKKVIFLPECHSTNESLSTLSKSENLPEGTVLWSDYQTKGRGQRGNRWESKRGENILASIVLRPNWLSLEQQFYLTFISGLAIREVIQEYVTHKVKVKWPNDVYVGDRKIAGILTEASLSGKILDTAIIGYGVNVNQYVFENQNATSIATLSGGLVDREIVLSSIVEKLEAYLLRLKAEKMQELLEEYYVNLLGFGEIRTFHSEGKFQGEIIGVDSKGHLKVKIHASENARFRKDSISAFGLKEISMDLQ